MSDNVYNLIVEGIKKGFENALYDSLELSDWSEISCNVEYILSVYIWKSVQEKLNKNNHKKNYIVKLEENTREVISHMVSDYEIVFERKALDLAANLLKGKGRIDITVYDKTQSNYLLKTISVIEIKNKLGLKIRNNKELNKDLDRIYQIVNYCLPDKKTSMVEACYSFFWISPNKEFIEENADSYKSNIRDHYDKYILNFVHKHYTNYNNDNIKIKVEDVFSIIDPIPSDENTYCYFFGVIISAKKIKEEHL